MISALCFFNVSNRHTFSLIFKRDLESPRAAVAPWEGSIVWREAAPTLEDVFIHLMRRSADNSVVVGGGS